MFTKSHLYFLKPLQMDVQQLLSLSVIWWRTCKKKQYQAVSDKL